MKELIVKLINYIKKEKKQIIFALFAFIIYYFLKPNTDMIMNGDPATVATAVKLATKVAAKAAAKGAATGAAKGAISGVANKDEGDSTLGSAFKGAKSGAISGAKSGAVNGFSSSMKSSMPKNTNPNPNAVQKSSQNKPNTSTNLSDENNVSNSKKNDKKANNNKKKNLFNREGNVEDDLDTKSLKSTKKALRFALTPFLGLGCSICFIFAIVFAVPLMVLSITDPISQVVSKVDCDDDTGVCDNKNSISGLFEKIKNLLMYQVFGKNEEVVAESVKDSYKSMLEKYEVAIDMPTLASTLLSDAESLSLEVDDDGNETVNKKILNRIKYAEQLADMQIEKTEIIYECKSNKSGYCKKIVYSLDLEKYYKKLKEDKNLLRTLYDDIDINDEEQVDYLIETIKERRELFLELYAEDEIIIAGTGNVPIELFYDSTVNMASPLKGSIGVTSPYGYRTGLFSGMHKGIDLVSNDKTIYAAGDGVVIRANTESTGGNVIEIMHTNSNGEKYITTYAHLSQFLVKKGDTVKSGDMIGVMGCTGSACTGVHLHFQIENYDTKETYNPANVITQ